MGKKRRRRITFVFADICREFFFLVREEKNCRFAEGNFLPHSLLSKGEKYWPHLGKNGVQAVDLLRSMRQIIKAHSFPLFSPLANRFDKEGDRSMLGFPLSYLSLAPPLFIFEKKEACKKAILPDEMFLLLPGIKERFWPPWGLQLGPGRLLLLESLGN